MEENMGITEILMQQAQDRADLTVQKGLEAAANRVREALKAAQIITEKAEREVEQAAQRVLAVKHEGEIAVRNERKKIARMLESKNFSIDEIVDITGYHLVEVAYFLCEPNTEKS